MKRRLLKIALWLAAAFLILATVILCLAVLTPLPDRIGEWAVRRAVQKSGGTLSIRERRGSLVRGVDLYGISFDVPGQIRLAAEHVHVRLATLPLTVGIVQLRKVAVENPDVVIQIKPPKPGAEPYRNPPWLNVWVRGAKIVNGRVEIRQEGRDPMVWSEIAAALDAGAQGNDLSFQIDSLSVAPPQPLPGRLSAEGFLDLSLNEKLRYSLKVRSEKSALRAKGSLSLERGQALSARLTLKRLYLPEAAIGWEGAPPLLVKGQATVTGSPTDLAWEAELEAEGLGPVRSKGRVSFSGSSGTAAGTASTTGAVLTPFWRTPKGREARVSGEGTWRVEWSGSSQARWSASASLGRSSVWALDVDRAGVSASGQGSQVTAEGEVSSGLAGPLTAKASWDGTRDAWQASLRSAQVRLPELLAALDLGFTPPEPLRYPEGAWNVPRAELSGTAATFSLAGDFVDPSGTSWAMDLGPVRSGQAFTLSVRAEGLDPEAWNLGPKGRISGDVRFEGLSFQDGVLEARVASSEWARVLFEPFQARIRLTKDGVTFDPFSLQTSAGNAKIQGSVTWDARLDGAVTVMVPDLLRWGLFLGDSCPKGSLQFSGTVSGPSANPTIDGRAWATGVAYGPLTVTRLSAVGRWDPRGENTDVTAAWEGLQAGKTSLGLGDIRLRGALESAGLELFTDLGASGRHLRAAAKGRLSPKGVDLDLSGVSLQFDPFEIQQEGVAKLSWSPKALSWSGLTLVQKKTRVDLSGRLGLEGPFAEAPISGSLKADRLPLKLLPVPPTAGVVGGHVDADLKWAGTVGAPLLTGQGQLLNGYYRFPESDLAITPITAQFKAEGSKLVLTGASATTPEGGQAEATGHMAFKGFLPADFALNATGKGFPFVVGRYVEGQTDFGITLQGTLDKPRIEGAATVVKGRVQLPETSRQEALPASIRFTNAPPGSPFAALAEEEPSPVGNLRGSVQLKSQGNLWVTSRSLLAELTGSLQVRFTEEGPAISGALNLGNGRYLFQGKKFEIQASKILFKGTTELNPYLDLNARYEVESTEVFVHITGPADKPELGLSSRPSMPQGDILSVLMFGRRPQELDSAQSQSWSLAALALAGQYQSAPLLSSIQDKLGLESLEVGAAAEGGTEVGFSKHLGDRVVVEYRQSFGTIPEQRVNVRYRVNRHVSVQADTSSLGRSGADVFWEQVY